MRGAVTLKVHLKEPYAWDGVLVAPMFKIAEDVTPQAAELKILTLMSKVMRKESLVPHNELVELAFKDLRKGEMAVYNVICYNDNVRLKTTGYLRYRDASGEGQVQLYFMSDVHPFLPIAA
ncbi:hypothetical protein ACFX14_011255 [Malus domestica]